jgi:hypothetical protein
VAADAISLSVEYMEETPKCAAIAYYIWNGRQMPDTVMSSVIEPGNCLSYIGAAAFLRSEALEETCGYREPFFGYGEEKELSLQLLRRGWTVSFRPQIVAHHRYSSVNRSKATVWKWALRNNLWTVLIHLPMPRIPVEIGWKVAVGAWDAFRLQRGTQFLEALVEAIKGAGEVWKMRDPLDPINLRRYDALRAYGILPYAMFDNPPPQNWAVLKRWARRWLNRLREGSFYSKSKSLGHGQFPTHEHELKK